MNITESDFIDIVEYNRDRLTHLSHIYTNRNGESKDLYQEMLIEIWRSLPSFIGNANINTWVYRVALNTAISFVRKRKTRQNYYSVYKKEIDTRPYDKYMAQHVQEEEGEQLQKLYEAISKLNASEKAIITMYLEDFSYAEIAFVTEISENYVGVKLNRIKKKLSKMLGVNDGT